MGPGRGGSAPARGESQEEAAAPPGASPGPGSFARQLCAAEQRLQLSLLPAEPPRGKGDLGLGGTGACPRMGMRGCGRPRRQRGAATLPCPQVGCRGCAPGRGGGSSLSNFQPRGNPRKLRAPPRILRGPLPPNLPAAPLPSCGSLLRGRGRPPPPRKLRGGGGRMRKAPGVLPEALGLCLLAGREEEAA